MSEKRCFQSEDRALSHQFSSGSCNGFARKPPHGLRGKQIGLWYAAQKNVRKLQNDTNNVAALNLTGVNLLAIQKALDVIRANTANRSMPRTPNSATANPRTSWTTSALCDVSWPSSCNTSMSQLSTESDPLFSGGLLIRNNELDSELLQEFQRQQSSNGYTRMLRDRNRLPAYMMREEIIQGIESNQIIVISGETGCGKTTQVPQLILESELSRLNGSVTRILVTQPRRISAISVAERVAAERGENIGLSIGYQVRLQRCHPQRIQGSIMYLTTGMLLQWLHADPLLKNASHVIVDEVHEREFLCDFLLNILRNISKERPDLRIILMSATLNADEFCAYFDGCAKLEIPGRVFPVQKFFLEDVLRITNFRLPNSTLIELGRIQKAYLTRRYIDEGLSKSEAFRACNRTNTNFERWLSTQRDLSSNALEILRAVDEDAYPQTDLIVHLINHLINTTHFGAVLVFVPGIAHIRDTIKQLRALNPRFYGESSGFVRLYPLHSQVSLSKQRGLFEVPPAGQRKVIIATNMAETSITIEDVVHVIDCGRIKVTDYDPASNTNSLAPVLVSRANAAQRRGRAGRVQSGFCYHLFSKYVHDFVMSEYLPPEMLRIRLEDVILRIKLLELGPVSDFLASCLSPPNPIAVERTMHFLREIQALDISRTVPVSPWCRKLSRPSKSSRLQLRALANSAKQNWNTKSTLNVPGPSDDDLQCTKESYRQIRDDNASLSALGEHLARLPMDPQLAKLLILGALFGCLEPALAVASCLNYRDPFEIPLDRETSAHTSRLQLSQNTLSDHWVFVTLVQNFRQLSSLSARRHFCEEYFLREHILKDVLRLMDDYATLLFERKYIGTPNPLDNTANINKDNFPLFRAILCGALFPNILRLNPKVRNGQLRRPVVQARPSEGKISLCEKSVNGYVWPSDPIWMVYFTKTKMDGMPSPMVLDTTIVPLRPILFFAGVLEPKPDNASIFTVDGWIQVKSNPSLFNLIKELRKSLDDLLESKFQKPSVTDWNLLCTEGLLLRTIVDLLVTEPVPVVQTQRSRWEEKNNRYNPSELQDCSNSIKIATNKIEVIN